MLDSQQAREAPGTIGSGAIRKRRPGIFSFLVVALGLASLEATAQTVTGLTTTPGGFSSLQTPLSPAGQAWPTVQSAIPSLWTPRGTVPPGPSTVPPFLLTGAIDLAEGYDTNPTQTSTSKAANYTRGQGDLGLHYDSLRLKVDAHSSSAGYYYYNEHALDQFNENLNLVANSELIPNQLFFNLNAFAAPVALTRAGQFLATQGFAPSLSNTQQSYGYVATPVYRTRIGDYVKSETSVSESQLFFQQPSTLGAAPALSAATAASVASAVNAGSVVPVAPLGNSTTTTVSQHFSSGPYFGRLQWDLTAAYSDMNQTSQTQLNSLANLSASYAINRFFSVLGNVGWSKITSSVPFTQEVPPGSALGGFRFVTGPNFSLAASAGVSQGSQTYLGSLNWNVTGTFTIVGSLTQSITSAQGNIVNNLSTLAVSPTGVFSNAQSPFFVTQQQSLNPQFATVSPVPTAGLPLSNSLSRYQQANLAFTHSDQRNQYTLSVFAAKNTQLTPTLITTPQLTTTTTTISSDSTTYGAQLSASRQMRPNLTGSVAVSYSLGNQYGGNDRVFTATGGLTYSLSPKSDLYVSAQYLQQSNNSQVQAILIGSQVISNASFTDTTVVVGFRHRL